VEVSLVQPTAIVPAPATSRCAQKPSVHSVSRLPISASGKSKPIPTARASSTTCACVRSAVTPAFRSAWLTRARVLTGRLAKRRPSAAPELVGDRGELCRLAGASRAALNVNLNAPGIRIGTTRCACFAKGTRPTRDLPGRVQGRHRRGAEFLPSLVNVRELLERGATGRAT